MINKSTHYEKPLEMSTGFLSPAQIKGPVTEHKDAEDPLSLLGKGSSIIGKNLAEKDQDEAANAENSGSKLSMLQLLREGEKLRMKDSNPQRILDCKPRPRRQNSASKEEPRNDFQGFKPEARQTDKNESEISFGQNNMKNSDFMTMVATYIESHDPSKKGSFENSKEKSIEFQSLMHNLEKLCSAYNSKQESAPEDPAPAAELSMTNKSKTPSFKNKSVDSAHSGDFGVLQNILGPKRPRKKRDPK
uniref:Uncharacterized protein n=1 Tax=Euplotes crassus TaxID=5936 RepID=A0A7S3KSN2_EUPCR|mmetsp:Transcript_6501/g.6054  ORF Transcript_6501/g.6054 Transcript_6501/m.6054 type:complete len:247 (+) Transcript_6501:633-1373(+)